jgi:hypothetical protein
MRAPETAGIAGDIEFLAAQLRIANAQPKSASYAALTAPLS